MYARHIKITFIFHSKGDRIRSKVQVYNSIKKSNQIDMQNECFIWFRCISSYFRCNRFYRTFAIVLHDNILTNSIELRSDGRDNDPRF